MCAFWTEKNIDSLRQGIAIPGITLIYIFSTLEPGIFLSLFNEKHLYTLFKQNMVGGPSIIFDRYHEARKTKIREQEMKAERREPKICQKIVGYDANALYLWAIMREMPTGSFTRRKENNFKVERTDKMATKWLECEVHQGGIHIRNEINDTEKRIGEIRLPVGGFHERTKIAVFQFHRCYWHGHECYLNEGREMDETRKKPMADLKQETEENSTYVKDQGYNLVEMWECKWLRLTRTQLDVHQLLCNKFHCTLGYFHTLNEKQISSAIKKGLLFGVVECDKEKFSEMPRISKNVEISREDIRRQLGELRRQEDSPSHSTHQVLPGTRARRHSNLSYYTVYPCSVFQTVKSDFL